MSAIELEIESLDHEGRGVAHADGKVIFVEGALAGERVRIKTLRKKPTYEIAEAVEILRPGVARVVPPCPHFGVCGGCAMQHLEPRAQVAVKQRVLEDSLWHIGRIKPEIVYRPIHGPTWGYRYRARLSVRRVFSRGGVLVGFHEKKSSFITNLDCCAVLAPRVSALLDPLRRLITALSVAGQLPQIEVAVGEEVVVLVLRLLQPLTPADVSLVQAFAGTHDVQIWVQPKGPDTAVWFAGNDTALEYRLPEFGVRMPFRPTDFTQVNHHINRVLVGRALRLLAPQGHERIVDLFCGLGNFTLPIATRAREVIGIEGSASLIARASENARANGLGDKTRFFAANLFEATVEQFVQLGCLTKR